MDVLYFLIGSIIVVGVLVLIGKVISFHFIKANMEKEKENSDNIKKEERKNV